MQGLVIEKLKSKYFTCMKEIVNVTGDDLLKYNWLISDYVCNVYPSERIAPNKEFAWLDGDSFVSLVNENDIQFIWAVFSGFSKDITLKRILQYPLPLADGNEAIWDVDIGTQNPVAQIEIISWDSSLLVVRANSEDLIVKFKTAYPCALDLKAYNASMSQSITL